MMKKKNKWKITAAAILCTAGILTAGYLYWCTTLDDKVIWKDVSTNGVALQGKTIEAAENYRPGHGKWYARGMDKIKLKDQEPVSLEIFPKASEPEKLDDAIRKTGIEKVNTVKS